MNGIYVEGHRGFCALYPENTLLSYRKAMELGVDAFEFDVRLSKDGVPVISHDAILTRTCGVEVDIHDLTLAELKKLCPANRGKFGEKFVGQVEIPTLREILECARSLREDILLGVEIKDYTDECVDKTMALLEEFHFDVVRDCWFYAFNGRTLRYIKEKYHGRTMGYPDFQMKEFSGYDCYDEIGLELSFARSELAEFYRAKGLPIHYYCADTPENVALCVAKGASLITANDPRPLMEFLRNRG